MIRKVNTKIGSVIAIIVCILITFMSVFLLVYKPIKESIICTVETEATIIDVEVYRGSFRDDSDCMNTEHNHTYRYLYCFESEEQCIVGYDYQNSRTNTVKHKIGDVVKISYNPNNPYEFMVNLHTGDYLLMLIPTTLLLFTIELIKRKFVHFQKHICDK